MKVISASDVAGIYITTDEPDYNGYTRYNSDCWYSSIGESQEPIYRTEKLEEAYQEWLKARTG